MNKKRLVRLEESPPVEEGYNSQRGLSGGLRRRFILNSRSKDDDVSILVNLESLADLLLG